MIALIPHYAFLALHLRGSQFPPPLKGEEMVLFKPRKSKEALSQQGGTPQGFGVAMYQPGLLREIAGCWNYALITIKGTKRKQHPSLLKQTKYIDIYKI